MERLHEVRSIHARFLIGVELSSPEFVRERSLADPGLADHHDLELHFILRPKIHFYIKFYLNFTPHFFSLSPPRLTKVDSVSVDLLSVVVYHYSTNYRL